MALQAELLAQGSVLRGELSAVQLERMRLEGELSSLRETNQNLDLSTARLTSQYQVSPRCLLIHSLTFVHTGSETMDTQQGVELQQKHSAGFQFIGSSSKYNFQARVTSM